MHREPIILYKGQRLVVEYAIRSNDNSESKGFIDSLDTLSKAKIIRIIKRYADFGGIRNSEQFRKVEGNIWEFKSFQLRILMYNCVPGCIALTHGYIKKGKRIPRKQIDRAYKIMHEYDEIRKGFKHEQKNTI